MASTHPADVSTLPIPVDQDDFEPPPMDAKARKYAIPWEWFDAVGIFFTWVALRLPIDVAVVAALGEDGRATEIQILISLALLIVVVAGWAAVRASLAGVGHGIRRAFGVKKITGRDVLLGIAYGLAAFVVIQVGFGLLIRVIIEALGQQVPEVQQEVQSAVTGDGAFPLVLAFGVAVLAPVGEELWFRGILYQGLAKRLSGWPAVGLSGLAFGLTHGEPLVIVLTFPLGMALALMLRRHGTLVVPIMAHAVFNLIGVAALRVAG